MVFLPAGAALVDIVPQNHEDKHAWAFYMAADYRALRYNPIAMPPQRSIVMLHKVKQFAEWHRLSPEWRCVYVACFLQSARGGALMAGGCACRQRILTEGVCPQASNTLLLASLLMAVSIIILSSCMPAGRPGRFSVQQLRHLPLLLVPEEFQRHH